MSGNKEIISRIVELKRRRNATIMAHNYQPPEVQDIADFCGDSLELARRSATIDADVIVFCGVDFMVEMAAILAKDKTVLTPEPEATCPMAHMVTVEDVLSMKSEHPDAKVVCYVNSNADVKALSYTCCTSANTVSIFHTLKEPIIFVPDKYLGGYAKSVTGREDVFLANGFCPTHMLIEAEDIKKARQQYPDAFVVVHPECKPEVIALADAVLSTGQMVKAAKEETHREFIVGTETGLLHRLRKENPNRKFYPATERAVCPNMKKITLKKILDSLATMRHRIVVDETVAEGAEKALRQMLSF